MLTYSTTRHTRACSMQNKTATEFAEVVDGVDDNAALVIEVGPKSVWMEQKDGVFVRHVALPLGSVKHHLKHRHPFRAKKIAI